MDMEEKINLLKFRVKFLENQIRDAKVHRKALFHFAEGLVLDIDIDQAEALRLYNEYGPFIAGKEKDLAFFKWELDYLERAERMVS